MSGPPRNPNLLKLIAAKSEWHWRPSREELRRGFRGWHERGYLPHFDAPNVTQLVTFMLNDSFPVKRHAEWESILREADVSMRRRKLETWLDRGHGACWLRRPEIARVVIELLLSGSGVDYQLRAWVAMPNHVHLVVDVWHAPLAELMNRWKGRSARAANLCLHRAGRFWQPDYFDTLIRDATHLRRAVRYVESNPVKAGLVREVSDWPWSSASRTSDRGLQAAG